MERLAVAPSALEAWARRRRRARHLAERYPFVAEMLRLYEALLDPQERAFLATLDDRPEPAALALYIVRNVMPGIVKATVATGPSVLAKAAESQLRASDPAVVVATWLAGTRQEPVAEYLARAASGPVLEAMGPAATHACRPGEGGCPRCGGLAQLSYLAEAEEALVTAPRRLLCARCGESWVHQRMTCAGCGEESTAKLPIYQETERLPHLRVDACETCQRYLITVDLRKDPEAVPVVDELAALPLDLYAQERGFAKIVPNLMAIG